MQTGRLTDVRSSDKRCSDSALALQAEDALVAASIENSTSLSLTPTEVHINASSLNEAMPLMRARCGSTTAFRQRFSCLHTSGVKTSKWGALHRFRSAPAPGPLILMIAIYGSMKPCVEKSSLIAAWDVLMLGTAIQNPMTPTRRQIPLILAKTICGPMTLAGRSVRCSRTSGSWTSTDSLETRKEYA